jgi:hypothetical protein
MAGRFSRSWEIFKSSVAVLADNKRLLIFPLLSSIAVVLVIASFLPGFMLFADVDNPNSSEQMGNVELLIMFAMYVAIYTVIIFFNSALVASVANYLDGGEATVSFGLAAAWSKIGIIIGYAIIAATVGMILKALEERLGFIGQIVIGLIGMAWSVTTFLVVPVLVHRDVGPMDAVKESATLLKKTWGENIIANAGMGFLFTLLYIPLIALAVFSVGDTVASAAVADGNLGSILGGSVFAIAVLGMVLLALTHATLQAIYGAALYRYASDVPGQTEGRDFSPALMSSAFGPKKK